MDEKLHPEDIKQLYSGNLMIYKGVLVKILSFEFDKQITCTIHNLSTGRKSCVDFHPKEFDVPKKRIGFVNIKQSVAYVVRCPVRKFGLGINSGNIEIRNIPSEYYPLNRRETLERVSNLIDVGIYKAYSNQYPSLKEAVDYAKEWGGACAFDKQFAVTHDGIVWYKNSAVGKMDGYVIKFNEEYSYLEIVLEGNYEKASGTFRATTL